MLKVYFAKSNRCSCESVASVKSRLSECGVDVIEHDSRKPYTDTDLLNSDHLFVLPEKLQKSAIPVGKGLASQIAIFKKHKPNGKIYIINEKTTIAYWVSEYTSQDVMDSNDWVNYGRIHFASTQCTLGHAVHLVVSDYEANRIVDTSKEYASSSPVLDNFGSLSSLKTKDGDYNKEFAKSQTADFRRQLEEAAKQVKPKAKAPAVETVDSNAEVSRPHSRRLLLA